MSQFQQQQQQQQQQQRQHLAPTQNYEAVNSGYICPHCGASVDFNAELCPHCMHPLHPETCTFCGAHMEPEDNFCCECGNPRNGILCPQCGTLNFRCFCSRCNTPLDDLARAEVAKAQNSPTYQKAVKFATKLAEMEESILAAERESHTAEETEEEEEGIEDFDIAEDDSAGIGSVMELSGEERLLMERYHQLLGTKPVAQAPKPAVQKKAKPQAQPKKKIDKKAKVGAADLNAMKAEYQRQLREMQSLLNSMQPNANDTPQMQRNFCCANKVVVNYKQIIKKPTTWICNWCHYEHNQPSECCKPNLGGVWKYNSIEVNAKKIQTI